jgi:hypothetical protein
MLTYYRPYLEFFYDGVQLKSEHMDSRSFFLIFFARMFTCVHICTYLYIEGNTYSLCKDTCVYVTHSLFRTLPLCLFLSGSPSLIPFMSIYPFICLLGVLYSLSPFHPCHILPSLFPPLPPSPLSLLPCPISRICCRLSLQEVRFKHSCMLTALSLSLSHLPPTPHPQACTS